MVVVLGLKEEGGDFNIILLVRENFINLVCFYFGYLELSLSGKCM